MKKVLIAHQSTIPHYRVSFYEEIERLRPCWWEFSVIYDSKVSKLKHFPQIDSKSVNFNIKKVKTWRIHFKGKNILLQSFIFDLSKYDLFVVENALKNVSYPLTFSYQLAGKHVMIWGHGKDFGVVNPSRLKKIIENIKLWLSKKADGFFAYTEGVKKYLVMNGVTENKIFSINNTIDIVKHRETFKKLSDKKYEIKNRMGLERRKVLLYVGRLNTRKRLDFLIEAFSRLSDKDPSYKLKIVGNGDMSFIAGLKTKFSCDSVDYHGLITDPEELAPLYLMSDLYVFPGDVGLGPIQALCYDLTPIVIDSPTHNPEFEYLSERNAVLLPRGTSPLDYANAIDDLIRDKERLATLRANSWPSIQHLTIENMAENFVQGINAVLRNG